MVNTHYSVYPSCFWASLASHLLFSLMEIVSFLFQVVNYHLSLFWQFFFDWSIVDIQYGSPQVELVVKNPPENAGDVRGTGLIPRSGRSLGGGHGNPLHYSCLENPLDRAAWWATVHGVSKIQTQTGVRHDWVTKHSTAQAATFAVICYRSNRKPKQ